MSEPTLNPCNEPAYDQNLNIDPIPPFCRPGQAVKTSGTIDHQPFVDNQRDVTSVDLSWLEDASLKKTGNGASALCDPQQTGHIINNQGGHPPNGNVVYRYAKSLRGTDEAMKDMFSDLIVTDEANKAHKVPIMWGTQDKAVAFILQENIRKDESLVVDRIRLPMLAIHVAGYAFNEKRYVYHKAVDYLRDYKRDWAPGFTVKERYERDTVYGVSRGIPVDVSYELVAWTMYEEDMNQIVEQIVTKFSKLAYIRVRGIPFEIGVKLDAIGSECNFEPGDKAERVFKYQFQFTAESFVSQPIVRNKAVLSTRIEITDSPNEDDITEVLTRLEQAVKELG